MDSGTKGTLSKFADDSKLCGAADTLEARNATWKDLDRLKRRDCENLMKFNKAKYKDLYLSQGNPKHGYRQCEEWIKSSPIEKDLRALINEKLITQQEMISEQRATHILSCIKRSVACRSREVIFSFNCSHETLPGLLHPALGPPA
ncbi:rna-directed dna polymerase from mobile element jockey-like [Willisornis vidua]|uniref:Rna-directed dna polymerase from mobile element jockey-like n=1 Tax=Willisornis vidua TaxID=1566151 RepID=A0ABQ9DD71_9PASS|nr:rna-directed dna polymerase from mobile element jockey-like [Willisornis vidua]